MKQSPALLLAHVWDNTDPTGWWMSEKLDGVRAYWTGTEFISRLGNKFHAPEWFTADLPSYPLDGELWGGRKMFQKTVGIVKRHDGGAAWRSLIYVTFDAPGNSAPFESRLDFLHLPQHCGQWFRPHAQHPCLGADHLRKELKKVEALGGEGLMLRQPSSAYEAGRSRTLLKVKSFHDTEATVMGHIPGTGKHTGRLGALRVQLDDGTTFKVGTGFSDTQRHAPPALGCRITVRYQELTNAGVPRFPAFVGERVD